MFGLRGHWINNKNGKTYTVIEECEDQTLGREGIQYVLYYPIEAPLLRHLRTRKEFLEKFTRK